MPSALHPQAKFDPIPPDLDLQSLVERTPNFEWVLRIPAAQIWQLGPHEFEKLVLIHVIEGGKPLVIEKWNSGLPQDLFSAEWLQQTYDKKQEDVRDINAQNNIPMTMGHYLRSMKQLTDQWTPSNYRDERRQRLYLKDIDCPPEWHDWLRKIIPPVLFYMNSNVEDKPGVRDEHMFMEQQSAVAPAGDLMSSLPEEMRAQNLMCYIGHEGTYTPAHREMCASLGQNVMVEASGDTNGEKPGSSIWFMTESKDREVVREYFLSMLGHDIEIEKHFAQINAWKKATFPVYIVEQKPGDFILIPPLAPHQVWNRGTRTMKVAWNRTTVETLQLALHEALPKTRLVCRDEQYKNKAIIYFTLKKYYDIMQAAEENELSLMGIGREVIRNSTRMRQIQNDFKKLLVLFTEVLVNEIFGSKEKDVEYIPFDSFITCSYCRCNIFNRFLTCKHCVRQLANGDEDTYDVCMECYAMGRSCLCVSGLSWCEQWDWKELTSNYEDWRLLVIRNDGAIDIETSPLPLEAARRRFGRKSLAQVCQEQLRRRPFNDITKPQVVSDPEPSEPEVDDNGNVKKRRARKKKKGDVHRCHVCQHKDHTYRLAFCSNPGCNQAYCYGVLYRAFDLMPEQVLQEERWQCPACLKICNCGACRKSPTQNPYQPKNTLLGHDTRPVADDRSVETLVDFRLHNLGWLKGLGDETRSHNSKRMERLRQQADAEKARDGAIHDVVAPLSNAAGAANLDDVMQQSVAATAYSDGSQPLGPDGMPAAHGNGAPDSHQAGEAGPAAVADMAIGMPADQSAYPDPSAYGGSPLRGHGRMLGMGYYEQDDTPDKILFDEYQMPSAEDLVFEEEPSEYMKKTLRAAKRRARQENDDDPDFTAPKSHPKKKAKLDHEPQDPLMHVDPALFEEPAVISDPPPAAAPQPAAPAAQDEQQDEDEGAAGEEEEEGADELRPFTANVPALRHSRPKVSYAEHEQDVEDFDETYIPKSRRAGAEEASKDPLDLAADAGRTLTGTTDGAAAKPATGTGRKRGRPRKSEPGPDLPATTPKTGTGKRRGRPPRSSLPASSTAKATEGARDGSVDVTVDELEAQLARELEEANNEDGEAGGDEGTPSGARESGPATRTRSGRPPRDAAAANATNAQYLSMAERMALRGKTFKVGARKKSASLSSEESSVAPSPATATARRSAAPGQSSAPATGTSARPDGAERSTTPEDADPTGERPAESATQRAEPEPATEDESVPPQDTQSGATSPSSDEPEPEPAPEPATEDELIPPQDTQSGAASPSSDEPELDPVPGPPKPRGPTIVRLGDSEDDDEDMYGRSQTSPQSESTSESGSDEDIPARRPAAAAATRGRSVATRGRGRGGRRGRGARGRGRGRGRGVARWS